MSQRPVKIDATALREVLSFLDMVLAGNSEFSSLEREAHVLLLRLRPTPGTTARLVQADKHTKHRVEIVEGADTLSYEFCDSKDACAFYSRVQSILSHGKETNKDQSAGKRRR